MMTINSSILTLFVYIFSRTKFATTLSVFLSRSTINFFDEFLVVLPFVLPICKLKNVA